MDFSRLGLNQNILSAVSEMGFTSPTPIQLQALPLLLQGEDLIGQAQTGTGKTAAFAICILERLAANPEARGRVRALILAPTRELAVQIADEIHRIGKYLPFRVLAVYGGQEIEKQLAPLKAGVDIVVGTPGRLLDHIERGTLALDSVEVVVLDEADRMLDMGFIEDIEKILQKTPKGRQTLLFSATMPSEIIELSKKYLKSPQEVKVGEDSLAVKTIKQYYAEVSKFDKLNALLTILVEQKPSLALVFVRTKRSADRLNEILLDRGFHSLALHGDMSQNKRDRSMEAFRRRHINILVATDLASRGLDVTGVSHVINYDMPSDPYTYIHRIGRTGRMGKEGVAISLVFFDQANIIPTLEKVSDSKIEQIKLEIKPELLPKRRQQLHMAQRQGRGKGADSRKQAARRSGMHSRHSPGAGGRRHSFGARGERREGSGRGHQYFGRRR
ncbi:MAG: DEAD/DEAH box helicase [Candidatus Micrarchaeota archaeon]|nr:DEAD/DEAH box helicase [Candidatus Micrarchaeota archaeon]